MSNSPAPQVPPVEWNPPGGDLDLDALFGNEPTAVPVQPQVSPTVVQPTPAAQPVAPVAVPTPAPAPAPQFFLDAGTSKYKTQEEAVKGFQAKDEAIKRLRDYAIQRTGFDPLTNKTVAQQPTTTPIGEKSYVRDGKAYVSDLVDALSKGDVESYLKVQSRLVEEKINEMVGPFAPVLQNVAKQSAIDQVSKEHKDLLDFLRSDAYRQTLDAYPSLKESIDAGERDPRFANRLPEWYRMARNLSAQAFPAPPVTPQPAPTVPVVRPTTTPSTATPLPVPPNPNVGLTQSADELMRTPQGRKQLIQEAEARGVDRTLWTQIPDLSR